MSVQKGAMALKNDSTENRVRLVFLLLTGFSVLFQLFQIGGLALQYSFLTPYVRVAAAGILLLAVSFVLALFRRYLATLISVSLGVLLLIGTGFAMAHPTADEAGRTLTGISSGAVWKFFVPLIGLLIPALVLLVRKSIRRRREEAARPYEKQF